MTRDDLTDRQRAWLQAAALAAQHARRYAWQKWHVPLPASVLIAQAIHESAWGRSAPANNYLGIKETRPSRLKQLALKTWEVLRGKRVVTRARFRQYPSMEACFLDYARLICTSGYYDRAVRALLEGGTWHDYLRKMGPVYATDPRYVKAIDGLVRGLILFGYDMALD